MKRCFVYTGFFCISILGLVLSGCTGYKLSAIRYVADPSPLRFHNDSIRIRVSVTYPARLAPSQADIVVTPYLEYEGGTLELKPLALRGAKSPSKVGQTLKPQGGELTYEDVVPYAFYLDRCRLKVKAVGSLKGKIKKDWALQEPLAFGTVTTPLMGQAEPEFVEAADRLGPVQKVHSTLLYFPFNSSEIRPSERESPDVEGFKGFAERYAREGATFKNIEVVGYASPEGPDDVNLELSRNRAGSLEGLVLQELNKIKNPGSPVKPKTRGQGRDLQGYRKKLEEKKLPEQQKLSNLVEQGLNRVQIREKVQTLSPVLDNELEVEIFAPLRRAEVLTTVEVQPRSDEELKKLALFNPEGFTLEEGLYTCRKLIHDPSVCVRVMEALQVKFPEDFRPYNNAGVFHAQLGDLEAAEVQFRKAEKLSPAEKVVKTNLGMMWLKKGQTAQAQAMLSEAGTAEAAAALAPVWLRKGRYAEVIQMMGDSPSFNAALAQLLTGHPDVCLDILDRLKKGEEKPIQYLQAIALAHQKNESAFFPALKKLISGLPPAEKRRILTDPEFLPFWNHPEYPKS